VSRVVVGLSGGVDSSVAALLLLEQGYEVIGVTFWLYDDRGSFRKTCCGVEALQAARKLCQKLDIPHYVVDLRKRFERHLIQPFVAGYARGETPNACLFCNRFFKFGELASFARDVGAEYLATGHFARIVEGSLHEARDVGKDQSYFLALLPAKILRRVLFPLGEMTKEEVREMARRYRLPTASRVESQEICFAEGNLRKFLARRLPLRPGPVVDLEGRVVGTHPGAALFTVGQRRGLGVALGYRAYVVDVDVDRNVVVVGPREAVEVVGILVRPLSGPIPEGTYRIKVRSTHQGEAGDLVEEGGFWWIRFRDRVWPPAPGQMAVIYEGTRVVGAGVVVNLLREGGEPWSKPSTAQKSSRAIASISST